MTPREKMVWEIKEVYGLDSPRVFSAMLKVPREKFIASKYHFLAYRDGPVPIGEGQTMSQPYTVAFMTDLLISDKRKEISEKTKDWKVLEIGTGSGYQAAVLSHLASEVYSVEIIKGLARKAKERLKNLGFGNVVVKAGRGEKGWSKNAPFDAILITAGIEEDIPEALLKQLKVGGVLVAPIGKGVDKIMTKYIKGKEGKTSPKGRSTYGLKKEEHGIFHFVPFVEEPD